MKLRSIQNSGDQIQFSSIPFTNGVKTFLSRSCSVHPGPLHSEEKGELWEVVDTGAGPPLISRAPFVTAQGKGRSRAPWTE